MTVDSAFYRELIENLQDGVYLVDLDRVITYWNKGAERITGYQRDEVVGRKCRDNLLNHVNAAGELLCLSGCPLSGCMNDGNPAEAEAFLHHADGHRVPVSIRVAALRDKQGNITGAVESFSNNSGAVRARQELGELRRQSQRDGLTGISNRSQVEARLRAIVAEFNHEKPEAGVLFIDVDHFKQVNDTFGHDVGDRVLRMVAATLAHSIRKTDVVGRWGGEEFVVLLPNVSSPDTLRAIADKLRRLVAASSLNLETSQLAVTISVGATLLRPEDEATSFVTRADQLMYQSKRAGRNRVTVG